jgi:hypothetical protein
MSEYVPGTLYGAERNMQSSLEERHRWADARRLKRQARAGGKKDRRFYSSALAALGCRLAMWGEGLQDRYGAEGSASVSQSARA